MYESTVEIVYEQKGCCVHFLDHVADLRLGEVGLQEEW